MSNVPCLLRQKREEAPVGAKNFRSYSQTVAAHRHCGPGNGSGRRLNNFGASEPLSKRRCEIWPESSSGPDRRLLCCAELGKVLDRDADVRITEVAVTSHRLA